MDVEIKQVNGNSEEGYKEIEDGDHIQELTADGKSSLPQQTITEVENDMEDSDDASEEAQDDDAINDVDDVQGPMIAGFDPSLNEGRNIKPLPSINNFILQVILYRKYVF